MFLNTILRQRKKMLPLTLLSGGVLIVALLLVHFINASANSGDISSAETLYPNIVGSQIDTCVLCHAASGPPNLNVYGAAYKAAGRNPGALTAIQGQDSDGDGFSNLMELMALTFPGNAGSFPAAPSATRTPTQAPPNTATARASATAQPTASKTATTPPGATATATSTAGATATSTAGATATALPTQSGKGMATKTPLPTAVAPCQDGEDDGSELSSSSSSSQDDDDENDCEDEGAHMTKTPKATEGAHLTKTPKPTQSVRATRTATKATKIVRMTRTPKATEVRGGSRGDDGGGERQSGRSGGGSSMNWFQNAWKELKAAFGQDD